MIRSSHIAGAYPGDPSQWMSDKDLWWRGTKNLNFTEVKFGPKTRPKVFAEVIKTTCKKATKEVCELFTSGFLEVSAEIDGHSSSYHFYVFHIVWCCSFRVMSHCA